MQTAMRYGMAGARDNSSIFLKSVATTSWTASKSGKVTGTRTDDNFVITPSTATLEL